MSRRSPSPGSAAPGAAPVERTWRNLLADALDNFSASSRTSRSPSPSHKRKKKLKVKPHAHSSSSAASRRGDPLTPSINGDFSSASSTPITSPTAYTSHGRHGAGGGSGGGQNRSWLLSSTRAVEQGRDEEAPQITTTTTTTIPSATDHANDDSEATLNELAARRAQMEVVRAAAASYEVGLCVPVIEPSRPRATAATSVPYSAGSGVTAPNHGSSGSMAAPSSPSSAPSSPSGEETELPFATECEACLAGDDMCPWRPATSADGSEGVSALALPSNWRALALSAVFTPGPNGGIPASHRAAVWLGCLGLDGPSDQEKWSKYYTALVAQVERVSREEMESTTTAATRVASGSASFSASASASTSASSSSHTPCRTSSYPISFREVLKDVERTLPSTSLLSRPGGPGQRALQRVLLAFSLHRPLIGYCQSLSFLAALILMVFQGKAEHLAFGVLCHVLEQRLAYYTKSMLGCVLDARVLRDLLGRYESDLASQLTKHGVSVEHFSASWLLCFFVGTPLAPAAAARVWDVHFLCGSASGSGRGGSGDAAATATADVTSLACGLALFSVHRQSFLSVTRPSPEALMNVLSKIVGQTTHIDALIEKMREYLVILGGGAEGESTLAKASSSASMRFTSFPALVRDLRRYHRHSLTREFTHLPMSRLRRLERSTGQSAGELQRLWQAFATTHPESAWAVHVSGVCMDALHWRMALAQAVFPTTNGHGHGHSDHAHHHHGGGARDDANDFDHDGGRSEAERWKASGIAPPSCFEHHEHPRATEGKSNSGSSSSSSCIVCVPHLPVPTHLDVCPTALQTCPRCTWAMGAPEEAAATTTAEASIDGGEAPSAASCTCRCGCVERGLLLASPSSSSSASRASSSAPPPSVFSLLFHYFDSSAFHATYSPTASGASGHTSAASSASSCLGSRGSIDFEVFVRAAMLMTQSTRDERLRAVFVMAGGGNQNEAGGVGGDGAGSSAHRHSSPSPPPPSSSSSSVVHGRLLRRSFESFVQAFEELYHGHSWVTISPAQQQQQQPTGGRSTSASLHPLCLLSSAASSRMFVSMSFEKERQNEGRQESGSGGHVEIDDADDDDAGAHHAGRASSLLGVSGRPDDSLGFDSFAAFIVLHPLISAFFRLDHIAD